MTVAPGSGGRQFDLDPFRGVVCLWLMGLHLCQASDAHAALLTLFGERTADVLFHVRLGVESFLVLAGFMVGHMLRPVPGEVVRLRAYFARRAYRLLLPFWAAILLAAADKWAVHFLMGGGKDRPGVRELVTQLVLVNEFFDVPNAAVGYWSMAALEQFYLGWLLLFGVTLWGTHAGYERAVGRMGVWALAIFVASGAVFAFDVPVPAHLFRYGFYIAFGVLLYGAARLAVYRAEFITAAVLLVVAAVWLPDSRLFAACISAGVLLALARGAQFPGGRVFKCLRFVGQRAYSVYLIHAIVGIRVLSGFRLVAKYGDWVAVPLVVLAAAASLVSASVFFRLVEAPCQTLARRVRYRSPVLPAETWGATTREAPRLGIERTP